MEIKYIIGAFIVGYLASLITVLAGCLLTKLEDRLEYHRIRRRSQIYSDGMKEVEQGRRRYAK